MIIPNLDLLSKPKYQCMKNVISFKWLYDKRGDLHIVLLKDTYMSIYFIFLTSSALWKKCNLGIFASKLGFSKILNVAAPNSERVHCLKRKLYCTSDIFNFWSIIRPYELSSKRMKIESKYIFQVSKFFWNSSIFLAGFMNMSKKCHLGII